MLRLEIEAVNAAFEGEACPAELARLLRQAAREIETGERRGACRDANGNRCGSWSVGQEGGR